MIKSTIERLRERNQPGDTQAAQTLEATLLHVLQGRDVPFSQVDENYTGLLSDQLIVTDNTALRTTQEVVHEQEVQTAVFSMLDHFLKSVQTTVEGRHWSRFFRSTFESETSAKISKNDKVFTRNINIAYTRGQHISAGLEYIFASKEKFVLVVSSDLSTEKRNAIKIRIEPDSSGVFKHLLPDACSNLQEFLSKYCRMAIVRSKTVFKEIKIDPLTLKITIKGQFNDRNHHGLDFDPVSNMFIYHKNFEAYSGYTHSTQDKPGEYNMSPAVFVKVIEELLLLFGEPGLLRD